MKVTIIPIVIVALGTKELIQELEELKIRGRVDWPKYGEESWRLEETCCHSRPSERSLAFADVKNYQGVIIIIIIIFTITSRFNTDLL